MKWTIELCSLSYLKQIILRAIIGQSWKGLTLKRSKWSYILRRRGINRGYNGTQSSLWLPLGHVSNRVEPTVAGKCGRGVDGGCRAWEEWSVVGLARAHGNLIVQPVKLLGISPSRRPGATLAQLLDDAPGGVVCPSPPPPPPWPPHLLWEKAASRSMAQAPGAGERGAWPPVLPAGACGLLSYPLVPATSSCSPASWLPVDGALIPPLPCFSRMAWGEVYLRLHQPLTTACHQGACATSRPEWGVSKAVGAAS
jgi:hypothetical protein